MERHYGMDWLRIGAFALLILYHVGMVFVPWGFHVTTAHPMDWVAIPMLATNAWRLMLLFVVSGYASRALFSKSTGTGDFLRNRNARLLMPLVFGMAVIVPPQTWVELVTQHGYTQGFAWFFTHDYFRFGTLDGIVMPTWNHLWFVVYLLVYTLVLGGLLALPRPAGLQARFDRLFGGGAVIWGPLAWLMLFQVILFRHIPDTHDLVGDGIAHLGYFPAFLFGFGLAGSRPAMAALARHWQPAVILALASYGFVAWVEWTWPGFARPPAGFSVAFRVARELQCWASIAALIGVAERFLNRDHALRPMLTEAVFPFYIIHQTVIIVVGFWILPLGLGTGSEFAILVAATNAGCWGFYLAGRELAWLRPLIGLRPRAVSRSVSAEMPLSPSEA